MPFHFYALAGVLVVGVAVVVAYEIADWHRREQERELEMWHAQRSEREASRSGGEKGRGSAREKRGRREEGEVRLRNNRNHSLLSDTDPFRLTDSEIELDLPSRSASPSRREASLLAPNSPNPHLSRRSSSSISTQELFSTSSSAISTPTLVSRPDSPSTLHHQTAVEHEQGGWDLINEKLLEDQESKKSQKALSEDDWEALEESVDWGKAPSRSAGGVQMASI